MSHSLFASSRWIASSRAPKKTSSPTLGRSASIQRNPARSSRPTRVGPAAASEDAIVEVVAAVLGRGRHAGPDNDRPALVQRLELAWPLGGGRGLVDHLLEGGGDEVGEDGRLEGPLADLVRPLDGPAEGVDSRLASPSRRLAASKHRIQGRQPLSPRTSTMSGRFCRWDLQTR